MKKSKSKNINGETALNIFYPFYLLAFILISWWNGHYIFKEYTFSWVLAIVWLLFVLVLCLDSVYYTFTKDEIYVVNIWGKTTRIPWLHITSVIKHDFWSTDRFTYEVRYKNVKKGKDVMATMSLPTTPKINKCMYKYYSEITVGTKRRKR